jgi:hypothetical protein
MRAHAAPGKIVGLGKEHSEMRRTTALPLALTATLVAAAPGLLGRIRGVSAEFLAPTRGGSSWP